MTDKTPKTVEETRDLIIQSSIGYAVGDVDFTKFSDTVEQALVQFVTQESAPLVEVVEAVKSKWFHKLYQYYDIKYIGEMAEKVLIAHRLKYPKEKP